MHYNVLSIPLYYFKQLKLINILIHVPCMHKLIGHYADKHDIFFKGYEDVKKAVQHLQVRDYLLEI